MMIARRTRDVAELNERARELSLPRAGSASARSSVGGEQFAVGDRVVTRINTPRYPIANAGRWSAIDAAKRRLDLTPPRR